VFENSVVFLSPHMDDAVLSCGGTIHCLNRLKVPVEIVTVFARGPTGDLSPFAKWMHSVWGLSYDALAHRREEDRQATASLGARTTHLPIQDSIYRRNPQSQDFLYTSRVQIFSGDWGREPGLLSALVKELQYQLMEQGWELLFAPLGVGRHVDHMLVRAAVESAFAGSKRESVVFYEDFPYVQEPGALDVALAQFELPYIHQLVVALNEEDIQAKDRAARFYVSQSKEVAGEIGISVDQVREYAARIAKKELMSFGERYWSPQRTALDRLTDVLKAL
jgi:LmbE family N-acetylglucosaminyl deacetylase